MPADVVGRAAAASVLTPDEALACARVLVPQFRDRAPLADKLRHVHLPGYLPGFPEHRPMYCARDMVFGVLALLAEFRFEGLIVSEVNAEYQNPNDLRMDVLLFETWRDQHEAAGW